MSERKTPLAIKDDPEAAEVYCSRLVSTVIEDGVIVVTLGVPRYVPDQMISAPVEAAQPTVFVTTRIALSERAARGLVHSLHSLLGNEARKPN